MTDKLPVYRISGRWKNEDVRDYPVFRLQVYTKTNELTIAHIENIAKAFGSSGYKLDPGYSDRGAFFYFELTEEELAHRVEDAFRNLGFDTGFVGSSTPDFLTDDEYWKRQRKK